MVKPKLELVDDPTTLETIFYILKGNSYAQDIAKNAEKDPKTYSRKIEQLAKKRIVNLETGFEHNKKVATINYKGLLEAIVKLKISELEDYQKKLQSMRNKLQKGEKTLLSVIIDVDKDINKIKESLAKSIEEIDKKQSLKDFLKNFIIEYYEISDKKPSTIRAMLNEITDASFATIIMALFKKENKDATELMALFSYTKTINPALLAAMKALKT